MTWIYRSSDGELNRDGEFTGTGYSGMGECRNRPDKEHIPMMGPIPKGRYEIGSARFSERLGPIVMNLTPIGHEACHRSLFRIHGDNKTHDASHGCIILGPALRRMIADSGDHALEVI